MDLEHELTRVFSKSVWDYEAILRTTGDTSPLPKESKVVTAIMEHHAIAKIQDWASKNNITAILPTNEREYPDITLEIGNFPVAVDIKTTRVKNKITVNKITLGSYGGYFRSPRQKKPGCRLPYEKFSQHWIVAFLYEWDPSKPSEDMVKIKHVVVCQKWSIASKSSGTGTTKHIGSITNIEKIKKLAGEFSSNKEFENYWRNYGDGDK